MENNDLDNDQDGAASATVANGPKRRVRPVIVVLAIVIVVCIIGGVAGGMYLINTYAQIRDVENSQAMEPALPVNDPLVSADNGQGTVEAGQANPIDFASLQQQNPDIYAWVYVPGTNVNYPVCQSTEDDAYYLTHNAAGEESELGAIFSERQFNGTDMQDRVTILYGHNGYGDTMFTALHQLDRAEFFDANKRVYVYAPGHIFTYEIVSAFMSDERHLMGLYNYQDDNDFARFESYIQNPDALGAQTREAELGADSKILVLSTCNTGALEATGRYIVCGVMVDDQPTA